jgi:formylmethanofuran dehydrogenase subunit A
MWLHIPCALLRDETNAEILDMSEKLGSLVPGKLADIAVFEGRPDENLDDLAKVDIVIRDGHLVVEGGEVVIPRHVPVIPPQPKKK